jgi:hypothetical protein
VKFKTVSEFIHALEVEGKRFISPRDPDKYFIEWREGYLQLIPFDPNGQSFTYDVYCADLTHDWQEYIPPEPETEEIELEEWMWKGSTKFDNFYYTEWIRAGHEHFDKNAFKTGVTRKVKVPK